MRFWFVVISALGLLPLPAHGRTPEEVACEEAKLDRLAHRMANNGAGMNLFLWAVEGDRYSGLAAYPYFGIGEPRTRDDRQMGFDLTLHRAADRLNPRRPLLPQAVLTRNDLLTTPFLRPTDFPRLDVKLELAPEVVNPQEPTQGVVITSEPGTPTGAASGAGRALEADNLFERCPGEENSAFDLQVFEILSRTLRISEALLLPFPSGRGLFLYKVILFRDVESLSYRAKAILYDTIEGEYSEASFQLRVRLALDPSGKLAPGSIEVLPWCLAGAAPPCTELLNPDSAVIVSPPLFAGHEIQTSAQLRSGAFLNIPNEGSTDNILTDDIPWPDLLRGTAWDRPLGLP